MDDKRNAVDFLNANSKELKLEYVPNGKTQQSPLADPYADAYDIASRCREWTSFQSSSALLAHLMPGHFSTPWRGASLVWPERIAYTEKTVEMVYVQTLVRRINIVMNVLGRATTIIGTPGSFPSMAIDFEGAETTIKPDWLVVRGVSPEESPPDVPTLQNKHVCAVGDTKLLHPDSVTAERMAQDILPGTSTCHKAFIGQVVHYCINLGVRFGFVLTNTELVVMQVLTEDSNMRDRPVSTRSRALRVPSPASDIRLPGSDIYSSPQGRGIWQWRNFTDGDHDIPDAPLTPMHQQSLGFRARGARMSTPASDSVVEPEEESPAAARANRRPPAVFSSKAKNADSDMGHMQTTCLPFSSPSQSSPPAPSSLPLGLDSAYPSSSQPSLYAPERRDCEISNVLVRSFPMDYDTDNPASSNPYRALAVLVELATRGKEHGVSSLDSRKLWFD
ncbi:Uu.00g024580.m01.CDS01 [Anthostomella pinea]|uniref:Uu.00g024580.m01.CDS01 n=1 Tax=Anthostomella pinea TaxID=933095 RepID=A0AAI8W0X7_9PEZI|nr:Uu.00g024580.m01.CDS01 [Anthostomella pinea]